MIKEYRNLHKLQKSRSAVLAKIKKKYGNAQRAEAMIAMRIDYWHEQDAAAARKFEEEQNKRAIAHKMGLTPEDDNIWEVTEEEEAEIA